MRQVGIRQIVTIPLVLLPFVIAGCGGDATGPGRGFAVATRLTSLAGPTLSEPTPGEPEVRCEARLSAVGSGLGTAAWVDGRFLVYIGKDTIHPVDSTAIPREDIVQSWEAPTIGDGETRESTWTMSAGIPFTADLAFRYQTLAGGDPRTTTVRVRCTPPIPADAPPPTITSLVVTPESGTLSVGKPLTVTYSAAASTGLWQTRVLVSGPCDVDRRFAEALAPSSTRSVSIVLPRECQLGVPITIRVVAFDAAAQPGSRSAPLSLSLADLDPPTISAFFLRNDGGSSPIASGDYYAGDTISVNVGADDNYRLTAVVWEVLPYGAKDSVIIGTGGLEFVKIPLADDYAGNVQIRLYARDAAGLSSPVITTPPDSIRVRPTIKRPTRVGTIAGRSSQFAIDQKRGVLYVAQDFRTEVTVVSLATLQVTGSIPTPRTVADLDLTPGGDSLFVAMYGSRSLGVVDLRGAARTLSSVPLTSLDSARGQMTLHVRTLANGHAMVGIIGTSAADWGLLDVALPSGTQRFATSGEVAFERSADGAVLMVSEGGPRCLRRYVVATDAFGPCATPRVTAWQPVVDGTGARSAIGNDVYDASMTLLPKLGANYSPGTIAYSALSTDGLSLYEMLWIPGIVRRRAADGQLLDKTPNPLKNNMPGRISADGSLLVMMEAGNTDTKIAVIDLR